MLVFSEAIHDLGEQNPIAAQQARPYVADFYTPGDRESRSCDTAGALVICVTGRSNSGSPLSDVAFVLQDVTAAAS